MYNFVEKSYSNTMQYAMNKWLQFVICSNAENKKKDKYRWWLHAVANMDIGETISEQTICFLLTDSFLFLLHHAN